MQVWGMPYPRRCPARTGGLRLLVVLSLAFAGGKLGHCEAAPAASAAAEAARQALGRATDYLASISTEGGYLWHYTPDLSQRAGENVATRTQVWVQPPGTPAVGQAFLRAYAATGDGRHLAAARAAGQALVRGQLESGGWDYLIEYDPAKRTEYAYRVDGGAVGRRKNQTTFDDNNTQSALRFLMALVDVVAQAPAEPGDARLREALDYGLKKMLEAQYPVGAWPQRWEGRPRDASKFPVLKASFPEDYEHQQPKSSYYGHYTLNDNTHKDATLTLFEAHRRTGRPEYLAAARRAADFLLLAQLPEPQPIWAQQYDARMQPAWARAFEPPSVTASESADVLLLLVQVYRITGDAKYLQPLPAAIAWYRRSELAPGVWPRLTELKTGRPLYGDRDGAIHYTLQEISDERQHGYSWKGDYGIPAALAVAEKALAEAKAGKVPKKPEPAANGRVKRGGRGATTEAEVLTLVSEQDAQGRWYGRRGNKALKGVQGPLVAMDIFIERMGRLSAYLESER